VGLLLTVVRLSSQLLSSQHHKNKVGAPERGRGLDPSHSTVGGLAPIRTIRLSGNMGVDEGVDRPPHLSCCSFPTTVVAVQGSPAALPARTVTILLSPAAVSPESYMV
jgi:hypothetical protein